MTNRIINTLLFLLAINVIYSQQSLVGSVSDNSNSETLPYVTVTIKYKNVVKKEKTDLDGNFNFQDINSARVQLNIKNFGYFEFDTIINLNSDRALLTIGLKKDSTKEYAFSKYNKKGALEDLRKGDVKLLLPGGIIEAPTQPYDSTFERKYNVTFISQGCVRFLGDNEAAYNAEVFKYLDEKYGKDWRKEIRSDVIGLKNLK